MQRHPWPVSPMQPRLPVPLARPMRRSLRGMRSVLHLGRDIARDMIERAPLPPPVHSLARTVLSEADSAAQRAEALVAAFARSVLSEAAPRASPGVGPADRRFAERAGPALCEALRRLGAPGAEVNEAALADAHAERRGSGAPEQDPLAAAGLIRDLVERGLRAADPRAREGLPVAAFAVMLWFQSDRARDEAGLAASIDLSAVLEPEIRQAVADDRRLAELLAEFRDHV